jgi:hypothetical protein
MKGNLILFSVLALLSGLAAYLYFTSDGGYQAAHLEQRDFAVKDTASITKLFFANTDNSTILLERMEDGWHVNNEYYACQECVQLIIKTIALIKVKSPVPESAFETTVKAISGKHVKVEIYTDGDKPEKIWYIGNATRDHYGTYMLLETTEHGKSTVPFITEIPGFYGFLSARFHLDLASWRSKYVFKTAPHAIQTLLCEFGDTPDRSFQVEQVAEFTYKFAPLGQPSVVMPYDSLRLKQYLTYFEDIRCENFVVEMEDHVKDSILNSPFFYRYTLTEKDGTVTDCKIYKKIPREENVHASGDKMLFDPDYFYAIVNDEQMMILQNFVFEKMFVPKQAFLQTVSVVNN